MASDGETVTRASCTKGLGRTSIPAPMLSMPTSPRLRKKLQQAGAFRQHHDSPRNGIRAPTL